MRISKNIQYKTIKKLKQSQKKVNENRQKVNENRQKVNKNSQKSLVIAKSKIIIYMRSKFNQIYLFYHKYVKRKF